MNVRSIHTSLGIICATGLAIAGMGWHAEEQPRPQAPKQVFCDIDRLMPYHPAWDQIVQTRAAGPQPQVAAGDDARPAGVLAHESEFAAGPGTDTVTRDVLKTRLEARAQEQLVQTDRQLTASLSSRMGDRRQELEAEAEAIEAEMKRQSEQKFAEGLRSVAGDRQFERTDAAIKIAALKAQLSIPGVNADRVTAAVQSKESELERIRSEAARNEEQLKARLVAGQIVLREQDKRQIDQELADLESKERQRIEEVLRHRRERLRKDIAADDDDFLLTSEMRRTMSAGDAGTGAVARAKRLRSECCSEFGSAAQSSLGGLSEFQKGLRDRTRIELMAVVRRIARESGVQVMFKPGAGAKDKTQWFRARLPWADRV